MDSRRIIYTRPEDGGVSVIVPTNTIEECIKDVPVGVEYQIIEGSELPTHRTFRDSWVKNGKKIDTDLVKAREHVHKKRREAREKEFAPYDEVITKQIPNKSSADAETERGNIRTKYATIQIQIDEAITERDLKDLYEELG